MSKSRTFSLYLLKENYNASNALKPENSLCNISEECSSLPQGATLYVMDKHQPLRGGKVFGELVKT